MFNLQGSEIIILLLLALVVLGPEKLPGAIRRFTQTYNELRKMGTGFQAEFRDAMEEPVRELRETADRLRDAADPEKIAAEANADAAAAADARGAAAAQTAGDASLGRHDRRRRPMPTDGRMAPNPPASTDGGRTLRRGHRRRAGGLGAFAPPDPDERPHRMAAPWQPLPPFSASGPSSASGATTPASADPPAARRLPPPSNDAEPVQTLPGTGDGPGPRSGRGRGDDGP